jgi:antitoxin component YwqK of YwqJK toxin-antitoxin module
MNYIHYTNLKLGKNVFLFSILSLMFIINNSNAQSKKEQILFQSQKIDSLLNIELNQKLRIDSLKELLTIKVLNIDSLNKMIFNLNKSNLAVEANFIFEKQQLINKIQFLDKQIEIYLDSLSTLSKPSARINTFEHFDLAKDFEMNIVDSFTTDGLPIKISKFIFIPDNSINRNYNDLNGKLISYWGGVYRPSKFAEGNYKNGYKEGKWIYYSCDGTKFIEGEYKKGLKTGIWKNYKNCNNLFTFSYLDELSFISDYFNISIPIVFESLEYTDDIPSDTISYYDISKELLFKASNNSGNIYYANNQIFKEGSVEQGYLKIYYDNGQLKSSITFDKNNQGGWILSQRTGPSTTFYKNGNLKSKGIFKDGNGIGEWEYYDENGKLIRKGDWDNDNGKYGADCPCQ